MHDHMGNHGMIPWSRRRLLRAAVGAGVALAATAEGLHSETGKTGSNSRLSLNARDFGTKGDGVQLDTESLQRALDRCFVLGGGEVLLPAGRYLAGSLRLHSNTTLRLAEGATIAGSPDLARYEVGQVRWEGRWIEGHLALVHALEARNVAIVGAGSIEGNPAAGGRPNKDNPLRHPALIEFIGCDGVHLEGFSTSYRHMWSIHPTLSDNLVLRNLRIRSTEGNGDGIDIDSCRHVLIDSCDIASGDDCISLKSGRGEEALLENRPTEDVHIVNCTLQGLLFAAIGVGSETSAGIRNVLIEHCRIPSVAKYAFYIKSRIGRGAFIEDIVVRNIDAAHMGQGFLRINQTGSGIQDQQPVPGLAGVPRLRNLRFSDIHVEDAPELVSATEIDAQKRLERLVLERISGTCARGISLANADGVVVKNVTVTGYSGRLLRLAGVTGAGLAGAETIPSPAPHTLVPEPPTSYRLE